MFFWLYALQILAEHEKKVGLSEIYLIFDIVLYLVERYVRDFPFKNIYKYGNINIFSVIPIILYLYKV